MAFRIKGVILVIISTLLWGVSGTVAQFLFQQRQINSEWLVDIRLLSSGIILLAYGYLKKNKDIKRIWSSKETSLRLIAFSIFGMLGVQYTYFSAIKHGNASTATILQYLAPVVISCYLFIRNKKLPSVNLLISIFLALIGTFLIITKGNIHTLNLSKLALFWGICSAFFSAIYTLQPVSLLKKFDSISVVGWGMLIGGIAFSFIHAPWKFSGDLCSSSLVAIFFIVVFGTIIAFCFYLESLRYLVPTESSILGCMEPLSATILSIVWLNIHFGFLQFIGTLCIISTVIILSISKKVQEVA